MTEEKAKRGFMAFNCSFALVNVHLLNLPFAAVEFLAEGRPLTFFDLWMSLVFALGYVLFYLNILDAQGIHFYIVFTPRTSWCIVAYSIVLLMYYGLYLTWNFILIYANPTSVNVL
jgi:hypothetical protein